MKQTRTDIQLDRRSALLLGMAGAAAAIVGTGPGALAADVPVQQLAPGVTLKVLKEVDSQIPGYSKARLGELTFEPGSKFGPETLKSISVCEITGGAAGDPFRGPGALHAAARRHLYLQGRPGGDRHEQGQRTLHHAVRGAGSSQLAVDSGGWAVRLRPPIPQQRQYITDGK